MVDFTSWNNLRAVMRQLNIESGDGILDQKVLEGSANLDAENVVFGESGLFLVTPSGDLTRVVVHLANYNVSYHDGIKGKLTSDGLVSEALIMEELHKYHVLNCPTLRTAAAEGWKDLYKMSRRVDGRFVYNFNSNSKTLVEAKNQRLFLCGHCHRMLRKSASNLPIELSAPRENFKLESFLKLSLEISFPGFTEKDNYSEHVSPNVYGSDSDWRKVSTAYREKAGWRCEGPNCPSPDLSDPSLRRYLHVHHKNRNKSDMSIGNLSALCVYCHANQPQHGHMKPGKDYKDYIRMKGLS